MFGLDPVLGFMVLLVLFGGGLVVFGLLLNASSRSEGHESWSKEDSKDFADNL